jgi:hypothetical protein
MIRGGNDEYFVAVCNKTGSVAIYNNSRNIFLSPYADGPIDFNTNPDGSMNVKNISRFGRSFSILRIPYSLKLLMQELEAMNVQMRIITDENVDQLLGMSYSDNMSKLLQTNKTNLTEVITEYTTEINKILRTQTVAKLPQVNEVTEIPSPILEPLKEPVQDVDQQVSPQYPSNVSPAYRPPESPLPVNNGSSPVYVPSFPQQIQNTVSPTQVEQPMQIIKTIVPPLKTMILTLFKSPIESPEITLKIIH